MRKCVINLPDCHEVKRLFNFVPTGELDDPDGQGRISSDALLNLDNCGFDVTEEGIRTLVQVLWKLGYKTACSCAGHKKDAYPYPWVAILVKSIVPADGLTKLLRAVARFNRMLGEVDDVPDPVETWTCTPLNTDSGFAIYLQPYDSNSRRGKKKISKLREESRKLAHFLESDCADIFGNK